jgi:hypothetical protein
MHALAHKYRKQIGALPIQIKPEPIFTGRRSERLPLFEEN